MDIHYTRDVFTPATIAQLTFVEREEINDKLVDALRTPGKQIVIYGHTGCGKTTLLENKLKQLYSYHIRTLCLKGMTFDEILHDAIRQLNPTFKSETSQTTSCQLGIETGIKMSPVKANISAIEKNERSLKHSAIIRPEITPQVLAETLGQHKACWVLEDFHKIDEKDKVRLAQSMKMFMDQGITYPELKMIFIGAVNSAREVISYERELRNRVAELHVPLMSEKELREIVRLGEFHLNISIDARVVNRIVTVSNGLAAACHQLALNFCLVRSIEHTVEPKKFLDTTGWIKALERYLEESSDTLKAAFDKSTKNIRKRKYDNGRLILAALTKFPQTGATRSDLLSTIRKKEPNYPPGNLSNYLTALQSEERGGIVTYDDDSGMYSFTEPIHRAFCVSIFEKEEKSRRTSRHSRQIAFEKMLEQLIPDLAKSLAKIEATDNNGSDKSKKKS